MKKNVIKTVVAAVCLITAGIGCFKAYNVANQSESVLLLAENVEALSSTEKTEGGSGCRSCWQECDIYTTTERCNTNHDHWCYGRHR